VADLTSGGTHTAVSVFAAMAAGMAN